MLLDLPDDRLKPWKSPASEVPNSQLLSPKYKSVACNGHVSVNYPLNCRVLPSQRFFIFSPKLFGKQLEISVSTFFLKFSLSSLVLPSIIVSINGVFFVSPNFSNQPTSLFSDYSFHAQFHRRFSSFFFPFFEDSYCNLCKFLNSHLAFHYIE